MSFRLQRYTLSVAFEVQDEPEARVIREALTRAIHHHIDAGAIVTMRRTDQKLKPAVMGTLAVALLTGVFYFLWRNLL